MGADLKIAVVIPCYRVTDHILEVIAGIGPEVSEIYVVDDACPDGSGKFVHDQSKDKRLSFIFHEENQGVGGAVISGYKAAYADGADVVVKIDGDGQMDPGLISAIAKPVLEGSADYSKGDRFDSLENLFGMPKVRIFGNAVLSLWAKFSTGYWSMTDPTNGFTAIHRRALGAMNLDKIRKSYFFESDILFRLNIANCVVADVPMAAVYGSEKSNMSILKVMIEFPWRHTVNLWKRIFYRYYLREWNVGSFELPLGVFLLAFGAWFGLSSYLSAAAAGLATTAGQVTASAVAVILGVQLLLSFISYDVQSEPRIPRQRR
ncbi:glycosyltransferase family 2 protein [Aquiluna sp.]|nr:glycosyltransferase family 2 protein [Aquiluna sp.]